MSYSNEQLNDIYERTNGKCHLCGSKRAFKNYGRAGARGDWHVDHSNARANGGSDHGNNLRVACISCNCSKGLRSTRSVRRRNGLTSAPLSKIAQKKADFADALGTAALLTGVAFIAREIFKSSAAGNQ